MNPRRLLPMLPLLLVTLTGCSSFKLFEGRCVRPEDYAKVEDNPPLQIPAGLQGPDARNALRVPALEQPERTRSPEEPCLDAPPQFSPPKPSRPAA